MSVRAAARSLATSPADSYDNTAPETCQAHRNVPAPSRPTAASVCRVSGVPYSCPGKSSELTTSFKVGMTGPKVALSRSRLSSSQAKYSGQRACSRMSELER